MANEAGQLGPNDRGYVQDQIQKQLNLYGNPETNRLIQDRMQDKTMQAATQAKQAMFDSEVKGYKDEQRYSHTRYAGLVDKTITQIHELSTLKGGEYAGDSDRLANFRRNATGLGLTMEQVWAVYAAKHWDAINQYVKDIGTGTKRPRLESIEGRADDLIVYLILFKAILDSR